MVVQKGVPDVALCYYLVVVVVVIAITITMIVIIIITTTIMIIIYRSYTAHNTKVSMRWED